jgi:thiamine transport system permease protein
MDQRHAALSLDAKRTAPRILRYTVRALLLAFPLLFLAVFYFYPLFAILRVSFAPAEDRAGAGILATVTQLFFWQVIWFTTWQAALSTALTLALGLPVAYVFARFQFPGKTLLRALTTIPFVLPAVVVAAAFLALLGANGIANRALQSWLDLAQPPLRLGQSIWMILLAHAFYNVSVIIRTVGGFWANLNPSLEEAAALLGADRRRLFLRVTLPLLAPSILAASLLVFLFCFTSFGIILILGGLRYATIEVEIYRQAVSLFNLPVAAFLSLVQMALTFAVMAVYTRLQARASLPLDLRPQNVTTRPLSGRHRWLVGAILLLVFAFLIAPLLALVWRSMTLGGEGFTLRYYTELSANRRQSAFFVPPIEAVYNSVGFATAATVLSLLLGIAASYLLVRPRSLLSVVLEPVFLLPLGTSAVTLGLGYIIAMGPLRTSTILTPIAHTLIAAPFVVRIFLPALRSLNPRWHEAAATLGASPLRRWRQVDVPILTRAASVGAVFAFTISLGEFGATLLVSRPDVPTMPVVIYRALGQPGLLNYGQALAMSTILMFVCCLGLILIERFRLPGSSDF